MAPMMVLEGQSMGCRDALARGKWAGMDECAMLEVWRAWDLPGGVVCPPSSSTGGVVKAPVSGVVERGSVHAIPAGGAWRLRGAGFRRVSGSYSFRGDRGEAVCSLPEAWEGHLAGLARMIICSHMWPLHVHVGRPQHVSPQRCNAAIPQVQSR